MIHEDMALTMSDERHGLKGRDVDEVIKENERKITVVNL